MDNNDYELKVSKLANSHIRLLKNARLANKAFTILNSLKIDPRNPSNRFEKLRGSLNGFYSKRINIQHRIVYRIDDENKIVFIMAMWTHYEF